MTNVKVDYSVTLKTLRQASTSYSGYNKIIRALQGLPFTPADADRESYIRYVNNDKIGLQFVLESNGLDDALWMLRCIDGVERDARLYAVWCARQVQHLMTDNRSIAALDVAERYVNGQATDDEIDAARTAANDAAWDAERGVARDAARDSQKDMLILMINGQAPWQV